MPEDADRTRRAAAWRDRVAARRRRVDAPAGVQTTARAGRRAELTDWLPFLASVRPAAKPDA